MYGATERTLQNPERADLWTERSIAGCSAGDAGSSGTLVNLVR